MAKSLLIVTYYIDEEGRVLCPDCAQYVGGCVKDSFCVIGENVHNFKLACDRCDSSIEGQKIELG